MGRDGAHDAMACGFAWSTDIRETPRKYPFSKKSAVAISALLRGMDPLLEVAKTGLRDHYDGIPSEDREIYALRFTSAMIRRISLDGIEKAGCLDESGEHLASAQTLLETCRKLSISSMLAFDRYWEEDSGMKTHLQLGLEARFRVIKERGRALRTILQAIEPRIDRIFPQVEGLGMRERMESYHMALSASLELRLLHKARLLIGDWSETD